MEPETTVAFIALGWLITAALLMLRSVRRGRALADALAERNPDTYEALGRPQPDYFQSARGMRFARFIMQREYEKLDDAVLRTRFEEYRGAEMRLLVILLVTLIIVFLLMVAVRFST